MLPTKSNVIGTIVSLQINEIKMIVDTNPFSPEYSKNSYLMNIY